MKTDPLVSILIPAYKAEEFLELSIKSALAQTWPNKEIVIVDDGSPDESFNIASQFACPEVKVHRQNNTGAAAARNKAFELSKGDYIQWLDADDLLQPDKISLQMNRLKEVGDDRAIASGAWGKFFFRKEKAKFNESVLWNDLSPREWLTRKMESGAHMQTATWLISRKITDAAGPWNTQLLGDDDGEYFCRVLMQASQVCFVKEAQVFYRATGTTSLSYSNGSDPKLYALLESIRLHIKYMLSLNDNERVNRAIVTYLQKYIWDFHPERPDLVDQLKSLASSRGGELKPPDSPRKYWLLEKLFGWHFSKRAQIFLPNMKSSLLRYLDKRLHAFRAKP
jgi:glycosyltransferase involved in cell wall biosynthesis